MSLNKPESNRSHISSIDSPVKLTAPLDESRGRTKKNKVITDCPRHQIKYVHDGEVFILPRNEEGYKMRSCAKVIGGIKGERAEKPRRIPADNKRREKFPFHRPVHCERAAGPRRIPRKLPSPPRAKQRLLRFDEAFPCSFFSSSSFFHSSSLRNFTLRLRKLARIRYFREALPSAFSRASLLPAACLLPFPRFSRASQSPSADNAVGRPPDRCHFLPANWISLRNPRKFSIDESVLQNFTADRIISSKLQSAENHWFPRNLFELSTFRDKSLLNRIVK